MNTLQYLARCARCVGTIRNRLLCAPLSANDGASSRSSQQQHGHGTSSHSHFQYRNNSSLISGNGTANTPLNVKAEDMDTYAVAILNSDDNESAKLSLKNMRIEQILKQAPGTHARDCLSLSLTSLGDAASRKRRAILNHYSVNNKIHPWFVLPRGSEIVMSFGCVRAIINRQTAYIFEAHKPTIRQQALRIAENVQKTDSFTLNDGQIILHARSKKDLPNFELRCVEEVIREVCTMYDRRIRLYEPIVNSLMDRMNSEAFSPSGLHKLVPVKDSLQRFGE